MGDLNVRKTKGSISGVDDILWQAIGVAYVKRNARMIQHLLDSSIANRFSTAMYRNAVGRF